MNCIKKAGSLWPVGCLAAAVGLVGYAWARQAESQSRPWSAVAIESLGATLPIVAIGGALVMIVGSCAICTLVRGLREESKDESDAIAPPRKLLPTDVAAAECVQTDCGYRIVLHLPDGPVRCELVTILESLDQKEGERLLKWALPSHVLQQLNPLFHE